MSEGASEPGTAGGRVARAHLSLLLLLWCDGLGLKLLDAVATGGFVEHIGLAQIPWLWSAEILVVLILASAWLPLADRWPRRRLVFTLFGLCAGGYGLCAALLAMEVLAQELVYTLVYLLSALQAAIVAGTLWMLAADTIHVERHAQLMPRLALGDSVGRACGYALSAVLALWVGASAEIDARQLAGAALCCSIGALVVRFGESDDPPDSQPRRAGASDPGVGAALRSLWGQPRLVLLAVVVAANWAAMSALIFYRIDVMDSVSAEASDFRALYAGFGVVLLVLIPFGQALASPLLARICVRRAFIALPLVLLVSALVLMAWPGLSCVLIVGLGFHFVSAAWDDPARYLLLAGTKPQLRGRMSALIDTQAYALGSLIGALALGLVTHAQPERGGAARGRDRGGVRVRGPWLGRRVAAVSRRAGRGG